MASVLGVVIVIEMELQFHADPFTQLYSNVDKIGVNQHNKHQHLHTFKPNIDIFTTAAGQSVKVR